MFISFLNYGRWLGSSIAETPAKLQKKLENLKHKSHMYKALQDHMIRPLNAILKCLLADICLGSVCNLFFIFPNGNMTVLLLIRKYLSNVRLCFALELNLVYGFWTKPSVMDIKRTSDRWPSGDYWGFSALDCESMWAVFAETIQEEMRDHFGSLLILFDIIVRIVWSEWGVEY